MKPIGTIHFEPVVSLEITDDDLNTMRWMMGHHSPHMPMSRAHTLSVMLHENRGARVRPMTLREVDLCCEVLMGYGSVLDNEARSMAEELSVKFEVIKRAMNAQTIEPVEVIEQ